MFNFLSFKYCLSEEVASTIHLQTHFNDEQLDYDLLLAKLRLRQAL